MSEHRPWLAHYPAGVPAQIDMDEFAAITDVFDAALLKYRDNPAFSNMRDDDAYVSLQSVM